MASRTRPDGLIDYEFSPGKFIPMPQSVFEQAGHTLDPGQSLFDPERGALAVNEFTDAAKDKAAIEGKPTGAPVSAADVGADVAKTQKYYSPEGFQERRENPPAPPAPEPAKKDGDTLRGGAKVDEKLPDPGQGQPMARGQGGGSRGRIVQLDKGGDRRASFTRVPGQELPEGAREMIVGDQYSEGNEKAAADAGLSPEQTFLSQSAGTIQEDTHDARTQQIADLQDQARLERAQNIRKEEQAIAEQAKRRQVVDAAIQKRQQLIQTRDAETNKLTPQSAREIWASKSTLQQIDSAVMMALGGYLQGLQGRDKNPGYVMVMDGITQEVADQRAKYDASVAKGEQARGDYADAIAVYGSPEAAALDIENRRLEAAAKLAENNATRIGTAEYKQAAALMGQELRQQKGQNLIKLQEHENGRIVQENYQNVPPQFAQIGERPLTPEQRGRQFGFRGQKLFTSAGDATSMNDLRKRLTAKDDLVRELGVLKGLVDSSSRVSPKFADELKQRIGAQAGVLKFKTAVATGAGAMAEHEENIIKDVIQDAETFNYQAGKGVSKIEQAGSIFERDIQNSLQNELYVDPDATIPAAEYVPGADYSEAR